MEEFTPLKFLQNPHLMTIAASLWPRRFNRLSPSVKRLFEVEPGTQVRGKCHWQQNPHQHPTLVLLHGLEGSSESGYILGTTEKAYASGFNVVRLNQRNCGGTERLTPTLYHSGLSGDIRAVVLELIRHDCLPEIFAAGFSMGGNLVLKMAGEFGDAASGELRGFVGVGPALDLAVCVDAVAEPSNFLYEWYFVRRLKRRMRRKASFFPARYPMDGLCRVRTVREFDDVITSRFCGFRDADDYYERSSAVHFLAGIRRPTLILVAQDDPIVPLDTFENPSIRENPNITFVAPPHGGHCAFISQKGGEKRFWSEASIVEFCGSLSRFRNGELGGRTRSIHRECT